MALKSTLGALVLAGTLLAPTQAHAAADPYVRDLLILTEWFEGQFDNEEQVWFEAYPDMLEEGKKAHDRVHAMHRRISMPELGEHVFYVEEYKDNNPEDVFRQRVVSFGTDPKAGGIRMRIAFLRDAKSVLGGYHEPSKLEGLTLDDLFFIEQSDPNSNCDVIFRRHGTQFEGKMTEKACVFGEGERRRYSIHNVTLSEDQYWRADLTRLVSDDTISAGHPENEPHEMRRALPFICNGRFFSNPSSTFDDGQTKIQRFSDKRLHSQGGTFTVEREADGQMFEVLMRTKQYPFYAERPDFLYFSVRKEGAQRSEVFTVNDINSRHMGATLPGMSAYCHRVGYEFNEALEVLDPAG
ncbi:chromophore lyase CpcT/CpeT [Erythrobacter sp. W53]|uniref:chromophore lyase CpcT/CpeT n=1 Tax=Erythrobacter sp. W53 TaxID=3425947 RepID=UPI003D7669C7